MPERRPRISVVNDNAEFLDLMAAILDEDAGYDVTLFKGEFVEISELAASDPDLIIVDLLLGGASGWEIVTLARSDQRLADVPRLLDALLGELGPHRLDALSTARCEAVCSFDWPLNHEDLRRTAVRLHAYLHAGRNMSAAARKAGVTRAALHRMTKRLGIAARETPEPAAGQASSA